MKKKAVVLLSGGLDSATCGVAARDMGFELYALSFSYGQRHAFELLAAQRVAAFLGVAEHRIVNIDLSSLGGSALTSGDIDVPKRGLGVGVPVTYVPARNTVFLAYALAWAEALGGLGACEYCTDIFIGVNCIDYSGYPDCRPEYMEAFRKLANLATVAGINGHEMTVHTPLIYLNKAEIIKLGVKSGLDYGFTHSCYAPDPNGRACGECDSCIIRKKGFEEAGVPDPTVYVC
ncbi:MAG: 7-cyano-7-deazaguanine synthase QueC [Chitinispirillales bacterium]|nr:7-cyano-7-deazaguanine synthase QueC [Chitinispirillales bacterium]